MALTMLEEQSGIEPEYRTFPQAALRPVETISAPDP